MIKHRPRLSILKALVPTMAFALGFGTAQAVWAADRMALDRAAIATDAEMPSYVQYAVEDLAGYLGEITGNKVPVLAANDAESPTQIVVGSKNAGKIFHEPLSAEKLGKEGFLLKVVSRGDVRYVVAAGATPQGTNAALGALMKAVQFEGKTPYLPADLDVSGKPSFAKRGMHFNGWTLNDPYTFRTWREQDWRRYLDILSYQGVNLFYVWPFIEIMPVPLSAEDQAYLEECRRLIDYAQRKRGMEVWIMQCTNRVAKDRCGVADPRQRPYWRPSQEDLNPGKPEDFKAIMASREAMYKILNNADGVCNIDSDPGFYPGSPIGDYVKVLQGCRELLTRHNLHGKNAKLVHWMLWGWGRKGITIEGLAEHQLRTLQGLKQGLSDLFWVISGQFPEFLPICRSEGIISRTVSMPYGVIELEPAYPATNVNIDSVRSAFDSQIAKNRDVLGVMGNVQTPLLQFPHVYYYTSSMWNLDYLRRSEGEVLLELSGHLYPKRRREIADSFLALKESSAAKIEPIADRLASILSRDDLGRPGVFGRKLFPDPRIVAKMLLLQLRFCAARQRLLCDVSAATPKPECERRIAEFFDAYLAWDAEHGWHVLWPWNRWPLGDLPSQPEFAGLCSRLHQCLGGKSGVDASFDKIEKELSTRHDAKAVREGCIAQLKPAVIQAKK
jgi:hypothetical protein